jgi:hypothetical protein
MTKDEGHRTHNLWTSMQTVEQHAVQQHSYLTINICYSPLGLCSKSSLKSVSSKFRPTHYSGSSSRASFDVT